MDDSQQRKSRLEIGHVLFIDIARYSKLTTEEESEPYRSWIVLCVIPIRERAKLPVRVESVGLLVTAAPKAFGAALL